jgi:hypothetical protein
MREWSYSGKEAADNYFEIPSEHSPVKTEANHEKNQSGQVVPNHNIGTS